MNTLQRAVLHEEIERLSKSIEDLRITRLELESLLTEDSKNKEKAAA